MTPLSVLLILISALLHSSWNFFTKRGNWQLDFFFWVFLGGVLLFIPFLIVFRAFSTVIHQLGPNLWWIVFISGLFETIYFACLVGAYHAGDLSIVYPISRSAPLFTQIWAVVFIGEILSPWGMLGIGSVMAGIFIMSMRDLHFANLRLRLNQSSAIPYLLALAAAVASSAYSVIDKVGVQIIHPALYLWLINFWMAFDTGLYLILRKRNPLKIWQESKREILMITILQNAAYLLVLTALQMSKVSYVVAFRQVGALLGAAMGILFLKERHGKARLAGILILTLGLSIIALAK